MNAYLNILGTVVVSALAVGVVAFVVFCIACMIRAYRTSGRKS